MSVCSDARSTCTAGNSLATLRFDGDNTTPELMEEEDCWSHLQTLMSDARLAMIIDSSQRAFIQICHLASKNTHCAICIVGFLEALITHNVSSMNSRIRNIVNRNTQKTSDKLFSPLFLLPTRHK